MAITVADTAPVQAITSGRRVITALLIVAAAREPFLSSISNHSNLATSRATTSALDENRTFSEICMMSALPPESRHRLSTLDVWVNNRHSAMSGSRLLHSDKRTLIGGSCTSARPHLTPRAACHFLSS